MSYDVRHAVEWPPLHEVYDLDGDDALTVLRLDDGTYRFTTTGNIDEGGSVDLTDLRALHEALGAEITRATES
jgi:hypothetical protein